MAFKLAEAFIELKARGEKELHKSLDKTKEKVKEVAPAATQTEKSIEKAATDAAKSVDKAADKMADALQKPVDKLAEVETEMKQRFASMNQQAARLFDKITGVRGSGQAANQLAGFGATNTIFGRFGGVANVGAAAGLVGIGAGVAGRANAIAAGEDSEVLGREMSKTVRDFINGLKEAIALLGQVGTGFLDALAGVAITTADRASFGLVSSFGRMRERERQEAAAALQENIDFTRQQNAIRDVDSGRPLIEADRRIRLDAMERAGGVGALEDEARRIANQTPSVENEQELLAVNERIAQARLKAASAGYAAAAAAEQAAKAAEREAQALERSRASAVQRPHIERRIEEIAFLTGRPQEAIAAQLGLNLNREQVAAMEGEIADRDKFRGFGQSQKDAAKFAEDTGDRIAAISSEGNEVAKLERRYRELVNAMNAMPAGAGRDAMRASVEAARQNIDQIRLSEIAGEELARREREDQQRQQFAQGFAQANVQGVLSELSFALGNVARPTAQAQTVAAQDFASLIQSDIFAKEDEQRRVEEEKRMHEEAQDLRERTAEATEEIAEKIGEGLFAVFG